MANVNIYIGTDRFKKKKGKCDQALGTWPTKFKRLLNPVSAKQKTSVVCIWTIVSESVTPGDIQGLHVTDGETKVQTRGLT